MALLLLGGVSAFAQERIEGGVGQCSNWNSIERDDRKDRRELLTTIEIESTHAESGFILSKRKQIAGTFQFYGPTEREVPLIAFWGGSSGDEPDGHLFSTLVGSGATFTPEDDPKAVLKVTDGWLFVLNPKHKKFEVAPGQICRPGPQVDGPFVPAMQDAGSPRKRRGPPPRIGSILPGGVVTSPRSKIGDLFGSENPAISADAGTPADVPDGSGKTSLQALADSTKLDTMIEGDATGPGKPPDATIASPAESAVKPEPAASGKPPKDRAEPALCSLDDVPIAFAAGAVPGAESLTVGLRNEEKIAETYRHIEAAGEFDLADAEFDMTASASRLVNLRSVAGWSRVGLEKQEILPVAVTAPEASGSNLEPAAKAGALRLLVVGAAHDVAMSGLDAVGATLAKQRKGALGLTVIWHDVRADGGILPAVEHASFSALTAAAAAVSKDAGAVALTDPDFRRFIANFEKVLKAQSAAADRVIWIKGAYRVPDDTPTLLSDLINAAAATPAVPRAPSGEPEKWLLVLTARMPGFSVAYLKEPVSRLMVGDVIDEPADNPTRPRRLLVDPTGLAARLRSLAEFRGAAKPREAGSEAEKAVTEPVLVDAKQMFASLGYVLSPSAAFELKGRLDVLSAFLNPKDARREKEALQKLTALSGAERPSIVDVVQSGKVLAGLTLPRTLPGWVRKELIALAPVEREAAETLVDSLLGGTDALILELETPRERCDIFYVPYAKLGLDASL